MERQQREAAEAALRAEEVSVHACLPACTCVGDRQCMCVPNGLPRACTCARCKRDVMMAGRAHMSPNKTTLAAVSCRPIRGGTCSTQMDGAQKVCCVRPGHGPPVDVISLTFCGGCQKIVAQIRGVFRKSQPYTPSGGTQNESSHHIRVFTPPSKFAVTSSSVTFCSSSMYSLTSIH